MPTVLRVGAFRMVIFCRREPSATVTITQEALAEELGTVREVVVRALRRLRESGIVRSAGRGKIAVLDRRRLERIAGKP